MHQETDVTEALKAWNQGDREALENLTPVVFDELRQMARVYFDRESNGHTLQPTALVNEVYLRLRRRRQVHWENRTQFFGFAAQLMRRILVDHARKYRASKRGGGLRLASLDEALFAAEARDIDLIALDDALNDLNRLDPEGCQIVEMRFFAGLKYQEIAEILDVSPMTVRRRWGTAKAWLFRQLRQR